MSATSQAGLQLGLIVLVLCATFAGPGLAVTVLAVRKRRARADRRSPIGIDLLRSPGHALREQVEDLRLDLMADLLGLATLLLAMHLAQSYLLGSPETVFRTSIIVVLALGCVAVFITKLFKSSVRLDNLRLGLDAEAAVGQELDQLMLQGATVFHDVPADGFNLDHVVVAAQGVFAIETKGYSKRNDLAGNARARVRFDGKTLQFPGWSTDEPLLQAERQSKWLSQWLSKATGGSIAVIPVLALPGWFVERAAIGSVEVYSGKELGRLLRRPLQSLSPPEVQRVAHQLDQKCRNVTPSYRHNQPEASRSAASSTT